MLEEGLTPMINRGVMRGHRGREVSSANQEAFFPEISTQEPMAPVAQSEVTSGVTLQQFTLLLQQVRNLTITVQNLQQTMAQKAPAPSLSVPLEHCRRSLSPASRNKKPLGTIHTQSNLDLPAQGQR